MLGDFIFRSLLESAKSTQKEKIFIKVLKAYFKLELLSTMYNETVGRYFLSRFNTIVAISIVASAFLFVRLFSLNDVAITGLSVGCGIIFVSLFSLMTTFCSKVQKDSTRLREFMIRHKMPGKVVDREMKCFKTIGVSIGSFFLVKRATPLTMLAMISNMTMTMLISVNFSI